MLLLCLMLLCADCVVVFAVVFELVLFDVLRELSDAVLFALASFEMLIVVWFLMVVVLLSGFVSGNWYLFGDVCGEPDAFLFASRDVVVCSVWRLGLVLLIMFHVSPGAWPGTYENCICGVLERGLISSSFLKMSR